MEVSELKLFLALAQDGRVSRAAKELWQMEERLGVALFHRKSEGVTLTPSGHLLFDYAEEIVRLVKEVEKALWSKGRLPLTGKCPLAEPSLTSFYPGSFAPRDPIANESPCSARHPTLIFTPKPD